MPNFDPNGVIVHQSPKTRILAVRLRVERRSKATWSVAAKRCDVLTKSGLPDPGLAYRIAVEGYEPRSMECRQRLGLPIVCPTCHHKHKRELPAWVTIGSDFLKEREDVVRNSLPPC
jgi:hypothetical protein